MVKVWMRKSIIVTLTQLNIICYNQIQIHNLIDYFIHFQLEYNIIHPSMIILTEIHNIFSFHKSSINHIG
jgi:hypothetical protein